MVLLTYRPHIIGTRLVRVRESHVANHIAPLLSRNAVGAVKLDVVLRGLGGRLGFHDGAGVVSPDVRWADLHDLCRPRDAGSAEFKRAWVASQIRRLEDLRLVQRGPSGDWNRPVLTVLRDDGSRQPLDDPSGETPDSYVTISGWVIAGGWLTRWGAPELAAYIAATIAERYARADPSLASLWNLDDQATGTGRWYRPLHWFRDVAGYRPDHHVRVPFSERTLRRGFSLLMEQGLISTYRVHSDPRSGVPFPEGPRTVYINHFNKLRPMDRDPHKWTHRFASAHSE